LKHKARGSRADRPIGNFKVAATIATESVSATYGQALQDRGEFYVLEFPGIAKTLSRRNVGHGTAVTTAIFPNANVTPANPYTNIEYFGCRFSEHDLRFRILHRQHSVHRSIKDGSVRPVQNGARPLSYLGTGGGDGFNNQDFLFTAATILGARLAIALRLRPLAPVSSSPRICNFPTPIPRSRCSRHSTTALP